MQLAKRGESTYVRGFFEGDDDEHLVMSRDWSAIELAIIGELSQDPTFINAYALGLPRREPPLFRPDAIAGSPRTPGNRAVLQGRHQRSGEPRRTPPDAGRAQEDDEETLMGFPAPFVGSKPIAAPPGRDDILPDRFLNPCSVER